MINKWAKGSYKGPSMDKVIPMLPIEVIIKLKFTPCRKSFTNMKMIDMLMKLSKRSKNIQIDIMEFVHSIGESKDVESSVLKLGARLSPTDPKFVQWMTEVSERDPKVPKTSTKNIQLAKQLLKEIIKASA
jgi:hypothetical protein